MNDAWSLNGYHQLAWVTVAGGFDEAEDILIRSAKGAIQDDATTKAVLERLELLTDNGQKGATGALYADAGQPLSRRCSHASNKVHGQLQPLTNKNQNLNMVCLPSLVIKKVWRL